ncbi:beta-mannanase [Halogeometricum borinquense]|uniref:Beta-mannanase n=1 Tax=Halogeometricum borinquense TaxID=60847 RepID=A0A6C0ULZ6_9EURY|nr:glycosyl hydrolase [Halogeometricum borinquense]QIB76267.1 beta-mannanase [Halogeometricum borinquense]QIQ75298.1 beta-mannanase [Halogeometricum borinquense]
MERRRFLGLVAASAGTTVGGAGIVRSVAGTGETRTGDFLAGVSIQRSPVRSLDRFGQWTGKPHAVVVQYATLGQSEEEIAQTITSLESIWQHGHVPMLVLEPTFGTKTETPTTISRDIADGKHDNSVDAWRDALTKWMRRGWGRPDRRLFLEFAPEMNGDWVPWGAPAGDSTPDDYVAMFRHVHRRVMSNGLDSSNVQWIWGPNAGGRGGIPIPDYYPGDDVVDWAGVNGYNWWNWVGWFAPPKIYGKALKQIRSATDAPIAITEVGCSTEVDSGNDPERKGAWITELYDYVRTEGVKMVCWFNHTKETDWRVFDSVRGTDEITQDGETVHVYNAYRQEMTKSTTLGAHPVDRRRLTDREFRGEF